MKGGCPARWRNTIYNHSFLRKTTNRRSIRPLWVRMPTDIFAQRKVLLKKKTKQAKQQPAILPSAADQIAACQLAREKKSEELLEKQKRKLEKLQEEDEKRKHALAELEIQRADFAKKFGTLKTIRELEDEEFGAQPAQKRATRRPPPPIVQFAHRLSVPEFLGRVRYADLKDKTTHKQEDHITLDAVLDIVDDKRETSVLVSRGGGVGGVGGVDGVQTLRDVAMKTCKMPTKDEACYADFTSWLSPPKWTELVHQLSGNGGGFRAINSSGNYNDILVPTSRTSTKDHFKWPCVLNEICGEQPSSLVVRMTRSDPFPCEEGRNPAYRSMKLPAVKQEMAMTLHAAANGFGTPIYSAVSWPWERRPTEIHQKYGLILVMQRMRSDATDFQQRMYQRLVKNGPSDPDSKLPPAFVRGAENVSLSMILRCYEMANAGLINFDIKPGNILIDTYASDTVDFEDPVVYIADFDSVYCVQIPDGVAGPKARFFVMLLLLSMHVRAYSNQAFVESFVRVAAPILMELWEELFASYQHTESKPFGEGAEWIYEAEIAFDAERGAFNHKRVANTTFSLAQRLSMQLVMMSYEYLFDDRDGRSPPKRSTEWPGWVRSNGFFESRRPRLVPQLMAFVLLHMTPIPTEWKTLLAA